MYLLKGLPGPATGLSAGQPCHGSAASAMTCRQACMSGSSSGDVIVGHCGMCTLPLTALERALQTKNASRAAPKSAVVCIAGIYGSNPSFQPLHLCSCNARTPDSGMIQGFHHRVARVTDR